MQKLCCTVKLWFTICEIFLKSWFLTLNFESQSKTWLGYIEWILRINSLKLHKIPKIKFFGFLMWIIIKIMKAGQFLDSTIFSDFTISKSVKFLKINCVELWISLWLSCLLKKSYRVVLWNCDFSKSKLHNFKN